MSTGFGFAVEPPTAAPALVEYRVAGALPIESTCEYAVAFVTNFGETTLGPSVQLATPASRSILVKNIPTSASPHVTARALYRLSDGAWLHVATVPNRAVEYVDAAADADLGDEHIAANTAHSVTVFPGRVLMSMPALHSVDDDVDITAAYPLKSEYTYVTTAGAFPVVLPLITAATVGALVFIKNLTESSLTVAAADGQLIGANATASIAADTGVHILARNATTWDVTTNAVVI